MEGRRWEDMKVDCLAKVFLRAGLESLVLDIPLICKTWYKPSLDPLCWKSIYFSILKPNAPGEQSSFVQEYIARFAIIYFSDAGFIKFVLRRSNKLVETPILNIGCGPQMEIIKVIVHECPALKTLYSPVLCTKDQYDHFARIVEKFPLLEFLHMNLIIYPSDEIFKQISLHCRNFVSFSTDRALIDDSDAVAIGIFLRKLKFLSLNNCVVHPKVLRIILHRCRELEFLSASNSVGFDGADEKLLKLASHIKYVDFTMSRKK